MTGTARSVRRKWIPNKNGSGARTSGFFVYDIVIDLRTLFCVSLNSNEPELRKGQNEKNLENTINRLKKLGWKEGKNVFGKCLICPKKDQNVNSVDSDPVVPGDVDPTLFVGEEQ